MSKSNKFFPLNCCWFLRIPAFTDGAALFSNFTQLSSLARTKTKVAAANFTMKPYQQTGLYKDAIAPEGRIYLMKKHTSTESGWIQGALASS